MVATGDVLKRAGMGLARENEKEEWKARYLRINTRWFLHLPRGAVFNGEAMRLNAAQRGLPEPHHANVWGAMASSFLKPLLRDGLIEQAGITKAVSARAHARRYPSYRKLA